MEVFTCTSNELEILRRVGRRLVAGGDMLGLEIVRWFSSHKVQSTFNISVLNQRTFAELLPEVLPAEWLGEKEVEWAQEDAEPCHPSRAWVSALWRHLYVR